MLLRGAGFLLFWIALIGWSPGNLVIGVFTAAAAAWTSLRLLPPGMLQLRPVRMFMLAPHFLWQSVVAGVDVARRAFDPRLPVRPGFVRYATRLAPGAGRNAFTSFTSLLPGTVPCGDEDGEVVYHCLDIGQPIAEQLAEEERRFMKALANPVLEPGDV